MIIKGMDVNKILANLVTDYQDMYTAYTKVDSFYENQKWTWHYQDKKNSQVIGRLLRYSEILKSLHLSIDTVVVTLCSLFHYTRNKSNYFILPDRFITMRNQMSKDKTIQMIYTLEKCELIYTKRDGNDIWVKLNMDILSKDPYFKIKCKEFAIIDEMKLRKCIEEFNTVYYHPYTINTVRKSLRENILGISLAYSELIDVFRVDDLKDDQQIYGKRQDISYIEVPVNLIAKILKTSPKKIASYVAKLYQYAQYISKHDKFYIDKIATTNITEKTTSLVIPHYYNLFYKDCELEEFKKDETKLEDGHPIITEYSAIIHNEVFLDSRTGQNVIKRIQYYKDMVLRYLKFVYMDTLLEGKDINDIDFIDDPTVPIIEEEKITIFKDQIPKDYLEVFNLNRDAKNFDVEDLSKIHTKVESVKKEIRLRIKDISKLTFNKVCKYLSQALDKMTECKDKDLRYYTRLINELQNRFKYLVDIHRKKDTMAYVYEVLNKYSNSSIYSLLQI